MLLHKILTQCSLIEEPDQTPGTISTPTRDLGKPAAGSQRTCVSDVLVVSLLE